MSNREMMLEISEAADRLGITPQCLRDNSTETGEPGKVQCVRIKFADRHGKIRKGKRMYRADHISEWEETFGYGIAAGARHFRMIVERGEEKRAALAADRDQYPEGRQAADMGLRKEVPRPADQHSMDDYDEEPQFSHARYDFLGDPFGKKA